MTREEERKHRGQAKQLLGWIFGWWCDKYGHYRVPNGFEIHHKDRNPSNNSLDNLVILTVNEHLKIHEETRRNSGGYNKKRVLCVETGIIYESTSEASRQTNISRSHIGDVCNGRLKTTGGYHWKFIGELDE